MGVHTLHVFDRKGKTLFTKCFIKNNPKSEKEEHVTDEEDAEQLAEQRKLVFGMLFSLQEVVTSLSPEDEKGEGLHSVRTGSSTLHSYETNSGLRFALYVTQSNNTAEGKSIRTALKHIYNKIWINSVTRSPLYNPTSPNVLETSFEQNLDAYLSQQTWYR